MSGSPRGGHGSPPRRPAKRPEARLVTARAPEDGPFAGWEATARGDFRAELLADLQSGQIERIIRVLDAIVVDHNMPNDRDELAATIGDVDPYDGLLVISGAIFDAIGKLPNR